jgi:hypothetical protein
MGIPEKIAFLLSSDPLFPSLPKLEGAMIADHATFVATPDNEAEFASYWERFGYKKRSSYSTNRFPARHVAIAQDAVGDDESMIGLSVSDDYDSPINKAIRLYGGYRVCEGEIMPGRLQHVAITIGHEARIESVRGVLQAAGVQFMTPILSVLEPSGGLLKQMFVSCNVPYGPFIEFIQRSEAGAGAPRREFDAEQIDILYEHYDAYSGRLMLNQQVTART